MIITLGIVVAILALSWLCAWAIVHVPAHSRLMDGAIYGSVPFMFLYIAFVTGVLRKEVK